MSSKKKNLETLGPGMELVRGGLEVPIIIYLPCYCSPGGWSGGFCSDYRCACGCFGPSSAEENRDANHLIVVPNQ
jgi:hypothetical protein